MTNPRNDIIESFLDAVNEEELIPELVRICCDRSEATDVCGALAVNFTDHTFRCRFMANKSIRVEAIGPLPLSEFNAICSFADGWGAARRFYRRG